VKHEVRSRFLGNDPETASEQETRRRTSHCDVEFLGGARRVAADSRRSAEYKQSDRNHGNFVVLSYNAMRHLVKHERAKIQHAAHACQDNQLRCGKVEVKCVKLCVEPERNQREKKEPTAMKEDGYPVDSANLDSLAAHRGPVPQVQYSPSCRLECFHRQASSNFAA